MSPSSPTPNYQLRKYPNSLPLHLPCRSIRNKKTKCCCCDNNKTAGPNPVLHPLVIMGTGQDFDQLTSRDFLPRILLRSHSSRRSKESFASRHFGIVYIRIPLVSYNREQEPEPILRRKPRLVKFISSILEISSDILKLWPCGGMES
jgi:hypothetical protein